jgi:hypothetical protein
MFHKDPHESAALPATLIPGTLTYYPAQRRGQFPNVRAALASIGCIGDKAEAVMAEARVNGSPSIAVSVTFAPHPEDEFAAVVQRKPGGAAVLWLGCLSLAGEDRSFVEDAARQFAEASGTEWAIFEWTRQSGAMQ